MMKIAERAETIREWIADECPMILADQKHLDANSEQRAYWHYGYLAALQDVLKIEAPPEDCA